MWLMLPTAAVRNSPGMGSESESSGCPCMDFTFRDATFTQTSIKLLFRERDFLERGHAIAVGNARCSQQIHLGLGCVYFSHIIFPTFKIKVITNTRARSYLPCPYLLPNGRGFCTYSSHWVPSLLTSVYSHQGLAGIGVCPSMNQVRGRNKHPGRVTSPSIQSNTRALNIHSSL